MNVEVPEFLIEMSQQMHQQSSRCTAEPIWQVRCKRYLVTAEGYNEHHWELLSEDGDVVYHSEKCDKDDLIEHLTNNFSDWCSEWHENALDDELCHAGQDFYSAFTEWFDVEIDYDALPEPIRMIHLQEFEDVIKTCFTEADALAFIARKQHDYPKLYTYVESMVFCPQMIELRNWIMRLTSEGAK